MNDEKKFYQLRHNGVPIGIYASREAAETGIAADVSYTKYPRNEYDIVEIEDYD